MQAMTELGVNPACGLALTSRRSGTAGQVRQVRQTRHPLLCTTHREPVSYGGQHVSQTGNLQSRTAAGGGALGRLALLRQLLLLRLLLLLFLLLLRLLALLLLNTHNDQ
jgi:hypothetical protein